MYMFIYPFIAPTPPAQLALLQYYCTTIAQYTIRSQPPVCIIPASIRFLWTSRVAEH